MRQALEICSPVATNPYPIVRASLVQTAAMPAEHIHITYLGHVGVVIESAEGVKMLTDYNGYLLLDTIPGLVTMNNSHDSHYTDFIADGIKHVLRGWNPKGGIARHNLSLKDMRIRNVPTNLTVIIGQMANGNSMFVFEPADLCVVPISHLYHVLSKQQLGALAWIDVAFASIDGFMTMRHSELFRELAQIRPKLIIPMHYRWYGGVEEFVQKAKAFWISRYRDAPKSFSCRVSRNSVLHRIVRTLMIAQLPARAMSGQHT